MKLVTVRLSSLQENCYIYFDENTSLGILIDPGSDDKKIAAELDRNEVELCAVLLTHGHFDHIGGVASYTAGLNIPAGAHEAETAVLEDAETNGSAYYMSKPFTAKTDLLFTDGSEYRFGDCALRVIHTPGHTIGSVCYYDRENGVLFSGDTLFSGSIGRSDFATGNTKELISSIKEKLLVLPDSTVVYPGHGNPTDIGFEKRHNPFIREI